nr:response regulator [Sphingomonas jejuensis]
MLVEDNHLHQKLYCAWLELGGHRVTTVSDGRKAVGRIAEEKPDLVIMDIRLPPLSGLDLIAACKDAPEVAAIPILALTVCDAPEDEADCLAAGAEAYLSKTVTMTDFLGVVSSLTRG